MIGRVVHRLITLFGVILYRLGLAERIVRRNRAVPRIALYHSCDESESAFIAGLGGNTPPKRFEAHLAFFERFYEVVPLEALGRPETPDRAIAITFDDGYRSVHTHAFPALASRTWPATVYLVTDVLDNEDLVWVNELNWMLRRHGEAARRVVAEHFDVSPEADPVEILDRIRAGFDEERLAACLSELRRTLGIVPAELARKHGLYLDRDQIEEMAAQGIRFGNHTRTHPSLPGLSPAARRAEIDGAARALPASGRCGSFAYPFGDLDDATREELAAQGFDRIMEVGGYNQPFDPVRAARVPMAGRTDAEVFAELEVVPPIKAWLKQRLGI